MKWSRWPLPLFAIAVGLAGILRLRDQAGTESGFLLAGCSLTLVGGWFALEVMRDKRDDDDKDDKKEEEP